ncbi:MAG: hypothetical protein J6I31_07290 [Prevotella sp.]|nr:hypothetical protein [Prevotella sp.]
MKIVKKHYVTLSMNPVAVKVGQPLLAGSPRTVGFSPSIRAWNVDNVESGALSFE